MGFWYRTVATSASAALTLCLLTLGTAAATVTVAPRSSEPEVGTAVDAQDGASPVNGALESALLDRKSVV